MAMGLLIGGIATAVIERVVAVASAHLEGYFRRRKGMGEELQRLQMLLPQIRSVVDAAEMGEQQISDPLKMWLRQLKDVLHEADDVVDELDYLQLKRRAEADVKSKAIKLARRVFKPDPALDNLRRVVKKLGEVAAGVGNFVALVSNAQGGFQQQETQTALRRETGPLLTENKVFGREEEKDALLRWLMLADQEDESNTGVSLFSVVGHGGMGKTTLAQLVYSDEAVQKSFDLKIWVCVSTSFDVRELTRSILESATKQRPTVDGVPALQDALKDKLKISGKFLVVLDDVWNDDNISKWDKLLAPLKYGRKGSKILVTTRMDRVAEMATRATGASTKGSLKLGGLHGEHFSSLFNRYAFAGVDCAIYQNLQSIGMRIVKRLGSSPLAAKTVGGLLNTNLDEKYWNKILHSKNISDRLYHGEDNIMSILMLSYLHLPLHLRPCFAYCGMFPKDHWFYKKDLVLMWMAVGLIQHSHQNQGEMLEDVGGYYYDELLRRSLFDRKTDSDSYVMHDLLHDLAQYVSHGECSSFVDNDKKVEDIIPSTVRHLYFESGNLDLLTKMDNSHNLCSLVLVIQKDQFEYTLALEKVFKSLKSIRMLHVIFGYRKATVPDTFSNLIHLRNLKICGFLEQFPRSLCKLYHLQAIQFRNHTRGAMKLPEDVNKLVNLRHLSADYHLAGVGKLIFLQELDFSVRKESGYNIGELGGLIWLRRLDVGGLENVKNQEEASNAKLCDKKFLQILCLRWSVSSDSGTDKPELVLDRLQPHANLKELTISGYKGIRYANWMGFDLINNLRHIRLSDCSRLDHLPHLDRLPFLEKFELRNMPAIKKLDYQCQHLKYLHICNMEGLEELSGSGADAGQWHPYLHTLEIKNCPKLEILPSFSLSITKIYMRNVGLVSLPTLALACNSTGSTSGSLSSSSLEALEIHNCGKITSLDEGLLLQHNYLTALEFLDIRNCPELVDFPSGGLQHLGALEYMRIKNCPKLRVAPDSITSDGNDGKFLPLSLQLLSIEGCTELVRSMPTLLKGLISLDDLIIRHCEELMSLEGLLRLQSIGLLFIEGCPRLVHATDFPLAVDTLQVDDPLLLVSGVLRGLTSVRQLFIRNCRQLEPDLTNLEPWLLQNQTTLERIAMWEASSLKSLPNSLKNLSSLKVLEISDATEILIERCRKDQGVDWPSIRHIPKIEIKSTKDWPWPFYSISWHRFAQHPHKRQPSVSDLADEFGIEL